MSTARRRTRGRSSGRGVDGTEGLSLLLGLHLVSMVGRGVFYALSALYFTQVVGLSVQGVGVALTIASGAGVVSSMAAGLVADRVPAKHVVTATLAVEAAALLALPWAASLVTFGILAGLEVGMSRGSATARQTLLARLFLGPERTRARARMRVVTNLGMGLGSGAAAVVLVLGSVSAFRYGLGAAALCYLVAALMARRLPVDRTGAPGATEVAATPPPRRPWRDGRYAVLACLNGAMVTHFAVLEIGVPVWLVTRTEAPAALVGVLLLVNTGLVVLLQVRLNRGLEEVARAGRGLLAGGVLLSCATLAYAGAVWGDPVTASVVLVAGGVTHALGEILTSGSGFSLSFELADPRSPGAYQGAYSTGQSLGMMLGPVLATTVVAAGQVAWLGYAVLFAALGVGGWVLSRRVATVTG